MPEFSSKSTAWPFVVAIARGEMEAGNAVNVRLTGPHNDDGKDGDVVPARPMGPAHLHQMRDHDGRAVGPARPDSTPGYRFDSAWRVNWYGGGFYNPHALILREGITDDEVRRYVREAVAAGYINCDPATNCLFDWAHRRRLDTVAAVERDGWAAIVAAA